MGGGKVGARASAPDADKHTVLSRYSTHRMNPQCVLTNMTQRPPHWFCVCRRSPLRPAPLPSLCLRPLPLTKRARADAHSHAKQKTERRGGGRERTFFKYSNSPPRPMKKSESQQRRAGGRDRSAFPIQSSLKSLVKVGTAGEQERAL